MINTINIIAVIVAPIAAVLIGQLLQNRAEKRRDKMELFKTLMMSRNGWNIESVRALNILDIVFSDDKSVRSAWEKYYDKLCIENPSETELKKIQDAQYTLLETMAVSLGYKDKITWKTIQNPYIPIGMTAAEQKQQLFQDRQLAAADRKDGERGRRGQTDGEHAGPPAGPGVCELQQFSGVPWAPLLWGFSAGLTGPQEGES